MVSRILLPSLNYAKARELLTDMEFRILKLAFEQKGLIKAGDLAQVNPEWGKPAQRTYQINKLLNRWLLVPVQDGAREYVVMFVNNYLLRGIIQSLRDKGFIPEPLERG